MNTHKKVDVRFIYDGCIVELKFKTQTKRGWFAENIQPAVELLKSAIPANSREFNPGTFKWQISIEYWSAYRIILKGLGFTIVVLPQNQSEHDINIPADYEENFYYKSVTTTPAESKESISKQLASLLNIHEDLAKMELSALKKKYREAARRYHPDMGGDAAKMAELNRVWSIYNTN